MNTTHAFQPISRRTMLQRSAGGFGWLALQAMLGREGVLASENPQSAIRNPQSANPLAPKHTHFPARAKRVVFLLM